MGDGQGRRRAQAPGGPHRAGDRPALPLPGRQPVHPLPLGRDPDLLQGRGRPALGQHGLLHLPVAAAAADGGGVRDRHLRQPGAGGPGGGGRGPQPGLPRGRHRRVQGRHRPVVANSAALGVFGLLSVAYAGSGFVGSMTACMNRMWQVPSGRNPVGQKIVNILIVMLLGTVLLGSALLTIWVSATAQRTLALEPTSPVISMIEELAGPASMLVVLLLLYRFLPARKQAWLRELPGALFGGVGFYVLKRGFDYWASQSAGIGALPRSLVSVVLLLVWLGFFGQLILYGAALNVVLDRRRRGEPIFPDLLP